MTQQTASASFDAGVAFGPQAWPPDDAVRMLDDIRHAIARSPADARAAASRLVSLLNRPAGQRAVARGGLAPWQKLRIERHVRDHLARPLRVPELAALVSLSPSYFHHAFRATFGTPPHAYVTRARLESARTMMLSTQEPMSQIAFACGFADQSHLCKIFRRVQGEPPAAWRRRNQTGSGRQAGHAPTPHKTARCPNRDIAEAQLG